MPAIFAHKLFATKIIVELPLELQQIINFNIDEYYLGALGPDPLYFYGFTKGLPLTKKADQLHRQAAKKIKFSKDNRNDNYLAFLFGYITHFTLDKNVHQYIYKIEKEYSHVKLEREFEYVLMSKENIKLRPNYFYQHIKLRENLVNEIASIDELTNKEVKKAYKDTRFITKYAYNVNKMIRFVVSLVMHLTGTYQNNKDMLLSDKIDPIDTEPLNRILELWKISLAEAIINVKSLYTYLQNGTKLNENFNYNFEGEYDD